MGLIEKEMVGDGREHRGGAGRVSWFVVVLLRFFFLFFVFFLICAEVKNCGSFKSFDYIYIYIYR